MSIIILLYINNNIYRIKKSTSLSLLDNILSIVAKAKINMVIPNSSMHPYKIPI